MKKTSLLLLLTIGLFSCGDDEENKVDPAQEASIVGKWDSKTSEIKEFNSNNQLASTTTQTYDPGVQWEFLADGKWKQYDRYQVVDNGSYSKQESKITISVSGETMVEHITALTANELVTRDTIRRADKTWTARLNKLTR